MSSRSGHHSSRSGKKHRSSQSSVQQLIESLQTHRVNTLTGLCQIERAAAACEDEADAQAFQGPMTAAWDYYVTSRQFLSELRGLSLSYPFAADLVTEAERRVRADPNSNRSWNLPWLCLQKMLDDQLVPYYASVEAWREEMWGGRLPSEEEAAHLQQYFELEWTNAINHMLRHWATPPTWY